MQNRLETGFRTRQPFVKPKQRPPVTIIIGIISKNAIVVASDSQTTYSSSFGAAQRLDTAKITPIEFSNAFALVAQSGDATLSGRAVEILADMAKGKSVSDYRTVADIAQKAVRQVKEELREQNLGCSMEDLHEYISKESLHFELMIAHYHDEKPYIFTIDFAVGIASKKPHNYTAIGCGSGIASYILSWFDITSMEWLHAGLAAIYTIEEVKKVDPYCGGKPKMAFLTPKYQTNISGDWTYSRLLKGMLNADNDVYVSALAEIDKKAKSEWGKRMNEVLLKANETFNKHPELVPKM
jgi:20S proteasome alpha/beta subunit